MELLLFNGVLKNLIFFQSPIKKVGFITLILSKFQILNANLWSIFSKRFEFLVYTWFWGPPILLGPSKKTQLLDPWLDLGATILKLSIKAWNIYLFHLLPSHCRTIVRSYGTHCTVNWIVQIIILVTQDLSLQNVANILLFYNSNHFSSILNGKPCKVAPNLDKNQFLQFLCNRKSQI